MYKLIPPYTNLDVGNQSSCMIIDHMGGFDSSLKCKVLDVLNEKNNFTLYTEYILADAVKMSYPNLDIRFHIDLWKNMNYADSFDAYKIHPELTFQNFLCSFNGSPHVSRKLLVAILQKLKFFDPKTCSKNFSYSVDVLDGHLADFLEPQQCRKYKKYFIGDNSHTFFDSMHSFGHYAPIDHKNNILDLEDKITQSFLHVVSETMATSYYPFVTEKFLYSVVTRGLFLAYAQPGWHDYLGKYFGFRRYDKIFDYRFDSIRNPVERLVELMSMIAKFSVLSSNEWQDLYEMEIDTIEYNYDHYFSRNYIKNLEQFS